MQSCLNCYNSLICMSNTPTKRREHLDNDTVCIDWEDDSVDWNEEE